MKQLKFIILQRPDSLVLSSNEPSARLTNLFLSGPGSCRLQSTEWQWRPLFHMTPVLLCRAMAEVVTLMQEAEGAREATQVQKHRRNPRSNTSWKRGGGSSCCSCTAWSIMIDVSTLRKCPQLLYQRAFYQALWSVPIKHKLLTAEFVGVILLKWDIQQIGKQSNQSNLCFGVWREKKLVHSTSSCSNCWFLQ